METRSVRLKTAILLASLPVMAVAQRPVAAPLNPLFRQYVENRQAGILRRPVDSSGHGLGLMPTVTDYSYLAGQSADTAGTGPIPSSYDLRKTGRVTIVRNQGGCKTCWAFAAYGALESSLLPTETRDFSEDHLKNMSGFDSDPCNDGGNSDMIIAYFMRWAGPINESDDPYRASDNTSPSGLPVQKHLQDVILLPGRTSSLDNDTLKRAVMNYGGIWTSMLYRDASFNGATNSYYTDGSQLDGHAVTLVGWDDNYNRSNFLTMPAGNGAFLAKNSWGTSWGDAGYFWISYYDPYFAGASVMPSLVLANSQSTTNYLRKYEYDPLGIVTTVGIRTYTTGWFANVFTAAATEQLQAVSFFVSTYNSPYTVYIYTGVNGDPTKGTLAATFSGTMDAAGYRTVPLPSPVLLTGGAKFSVVVKLTTPNTNLLVPIQYAVEGYSSHSVASPQHGYYGADGTAWQDITTFDPTASICVKAYTGAAPVLLPKLTIAKSHTGNFTRGQKGATYSITVGNSGPGVVSTSPAVTVNESLPTGLTAISISGSGWNCTQPAGPCSRGDALAVNGAYPPITLTVNVASDAPSALVNQATVSGGGSSAATASDPTSTTAAPSMLSIAKTHSGSIYPGQTGATYTLVVSNGSAAGPTASQVTVTDILPSGLTMVSMAGPGWSCGSTTCTRSDILSGGSSYPAITVTVNVSASVGSQVTNQATVSGGGSGSATANDLTYVTTLSTLQLVSGAVNGQAVSASAPAISVMVGAMLSGTFTVRINSTFSSNVVTAMAATPTWGSHSGSYYDLGGFSTPTSGTTRSVPVNWQAPTVPGTYYIVTAFAGEFEAASVMSCTNWTVASPIWNDGNDVADWSAATVESAMTNGTVQVAYRYPDGMHQVYVPATAIRVVVTSPPVNTSTLQFVSGTVNGQTVSAADPTIKVTPGATLSGSFNVRVYSTFTSNVVMAMGATPTWGSHSTSYVDLTGFSTPTSGLTRSVPVNWNAPTVPGTYYIVAAFAGEYSASSVMSCTNWTYGSAAWGDGNDVADWSAATIQAAIANGTVQVPYRYTDGMHQVYVPSTAIRIVVADPSPQQTSTLQLVSGLVNGIAVSPSNSTVNVIGGKSVSGAITVRINSTFSSSAVMAMGITPTWGAHSTSYGDLGGFSTPVSGLLRSIPINWQAPSLPGTYYIVAAFNGEFDSSSVMSCTNWSYGPAAWDDGNDIAGWSAVTVEAAIANGNVQVPYRYVDGMHSQYVPSTAIRVVVTTPPILTITNSHIGSFMPGQNASFTMTVSNATGGGASSGAITVTEAVPVGLSLVSMSGAGWTCGGGSCWRSDALLPGASYPPITVTVSVLSNAAPQVTALAGVSGGSSAAATAPDTVSVGNCTVSVSPLSPVASGAGGPLILTLAGGACGWTASSSTPWLTPAATSGTTTTLTVTVAPNATGAQRTGSLTVSGQTVNVTQAAGNTAPGPSLVSLNPFQGTGLTANLTLVYADPSGWAAIQSAEFIINPRWEPGTRGGGCYVKYAPGTGLFTLIGDDGISIAGTTAPGSSTNTSNSQCTLNASNSSVSGSGNNLTVVASLTFQPTFGGQRHIWMQATDYYNVSTNWLVYGAWSPTQTTVNAIPWYRIYDPNSNSYLYSADQNEYNSLGLEGFTQQGVSGLVMDGAGSAGGISNIAWYRVFVNATSSHFWTSDRNEFLTLINAQQAYVGEGVAAFAMPYLNALGQISPEVTNTIPFYRAAFQGKNLHFWTSDADEYFGRNGKHLPAGYAGEGIACYIFPSSGAQFNSTPLNPEEEGSPQVVSVMNGASRVRRGVIAPGQVVTILGRHLGGTVLLNGAPAKIVGTTANEIRVLAPDGLAEGAEVTVEVEHEGRRSKPVKLIVVTADPAIFGTNPYGRGNAQARNDNGTANSPEHAAARGSIVTLYTTGFAGSNLPIEVHIGGYPAEVISAQVSATREGVIEVQVRVPGMLDAAAFQPVVLHVGNLFSQPGVGLAIR